MDIQFFLSPTKITRLHTCYISMLTRIVLFLFLAASMNTGVHAQEEFKIAILPHLERPLMTRLLEEHNQHLSTRLNRPVQFYMDESYEHLYRRVVQKDFDLVIIEPHLAYLLKQRYQYRPILHLDAKYKVHWVVKSNSKLTNLNDFNHSNIAYPDKISLVTLISNKMLKNNDVDTDAIRSNFVTEEKSLMMLMSGDVDGALVEQTTLNQLSKSSRDHVKIIKSLDDIDWMGSVWLCGPKVSTVMCDQIRQHLLDFNDGKKGRTWLAKLNAEKLGIIDNNIWVKAKLYADRIINMRLLNTTKQ